MRTLHMLTAATALLVAVAGSSFAASQADRAKGARSIDQSSRQNWNQAPYNAPYNAWGRGSVNDAYASGRRNGEALPFPGYGPYPDRPYGDPGRW